VFGNGNNANGVVAGVRGAGGERMGRNRVAVGDYPGYQFRFGVRNRFFFDFI